MLGLMKYKPEVVVHVVISRTWRSKVSISYLFWDIVLGQPGLKQILTKNTGKKKTSEKQWLFAGMI